MEVRIDSGDAGKRIAGAVQQLRNGTSLFSELAGALEYETMANFSAQGRPSWVPHSKATKRERLSRNKGSSLLNILQDSGTLAKSISQFYGSDHAGVGAGGAAAAYAGIHQFGGQVEHAAHSVRVRLRKDAKGTLQRQKDHRNLAVFAKDSHKRVRESWATVEAYTVDIPARPYLPFSGPPEAPTLQPSAEQSILDVLEAFLQRSLG